MKNTIIEWFNSYESTYAENIELLEILCSSIGLTTISIGEKKLYDFIVKEYKSKASQVNSQDITQLEKIKILMEELNLDMKMSYYLLKSL